MYKGERIISFVVGIHYVNVSRVSQDLYVYNYHNEWISR